MLLRWAVQPEMLSESVCNFYNNNNEYESIISTFQWNLIYMQHRVYFLPAVNSLFIHCTLVVETS